MSATIPNLVAELSAQRGMIEELIRLLELEEAYIAGLDLERLEDIGEKKKELFVKLESSSNTCRQLIRQVGEELQITDSTSLSVILEKLPSGHRESLQALQRKILELKGSLDSTVARNRELLQGAFNSVSRSLEFFRNLFSRSATYGFGGQMVGATANARIIRKEI